MLGKELWKKTEVSVLEMRKTGGTGQNQKGTSESVAESGKNGEHFLPRGGKSIQALGEGIGESERLIRMVTLLKKKQGKGMGLKGKGVSVGEKE